jgi:ATP-dependent DNA helicase RecG
VGPRRDYATEQEERRLIERRVSHAKTFDAQPAFGATTDDLALPLFLLDYRTRAVAAEVIAENNRSVEHQLASLRFFDLEHRRPTNAGILLFGIDVKRWLPGAYVQFLRINGESLAAPVVNDREIHGDLLTVLRNLDALIDAYIEQYPVTVSTLRERTVEVYPRVAVRELVMNAVMHRDYASTAPIRFTFFSDRVEIQSPGGLYGEVSPDNFPEQTSYRNPVIAEAMNALGYVNRFGRGVIRAQRALQENGSSSAQFRFDPGFVRATIRKRN